MFHSLIYTRRNSTTSFFVQYRYNGTDYNFGKIRLFFTLKEDTFALIEHHSVQKKFSDFFLCSKYHELLRKSIDVFFFVLMPQLSALRCVSINEIENHCICFQFLNSIIVTPLSVSHEHDWFILDSQFSFRKVAYCIFIGFEILSDHFDSNRTMLNTTDRHRDKRIHHATKIFSPTNASLSSFTHYLIYIGDTSSFLIVGKASVKKVQGKVATLVFDKKKFFGEIVMSGIVLFVNEKTF